MLASVAAMDVSYHRQWPAFSSPKPGRCCVTFQGAHGKFCQHGWNIRHLLLHMENIWYSIYGWKIRTWKSEIIFLYGKKKGWKYGVTLVRRKSQNIVSGAERDDQLMYQLWFKQSETDVVCILPTFPNSSSVPSNWHFLDETTFLTFSWASWKKTKLICKWYILGKSQAGEWLVSLQLINEKMNFVIPSVLKKVF